jgi:pyruvate dehydrogenase E2 component (dihydrolipoamide acetyltransferase)
MAEVVMPRLSDSMEEGTIISWLIADGADVVRGVELLEVETDKATMTYEAEADGILRIAAPQGSTVAVGTVIATIGDAEARAATKLAPTGPVAMSFTASANPPAAAPPPVAGGQLGRINASPLARRVAARRGVALSSLRGSGVNGRIVRRDVERASTSNGIGDVAHAPRAAAATVPDAPVPATVRLGPPAWPPPPPSGAATQQLTRTQQLIARRMSEAKATVPEFTLSIEVDAAAALDLRARFKELPAAGQIVPSLNDMIVKACARALRQHARANGSFVDGAFVLHPRVNVGVAVAAPDSLLVPTVFDADTRSLGDIARETRRLSSAARAGEITPQELSGATFTVSNLGMYGITSFQAIINPPQAAILAVGAVQERAVVRDGTLLPGQVMTLTLTCDHRILYGADAAAFLGDVRSALEQPLHLAL